MSQMPLDPQGPRSPDVPRQRDVPRSPDNKTGQIFYRKQSAHFDQNTGFHSGPSARRKGAKLAAWSALASLIDGFILIAISCFFMASFSLIVQTSWGEILRTLGQGQHQILFFVEVMIASSWFYMIVTRYIMGASIGEWACNMRLGQPQERLSSVYLFRVTLRASVVIATGLFTLTILSILFRRDLAGEISGLKLLSLR